MSRFFPQLAALCGCLLAWPAVAQPGPAAAVDPADARAVVPERPYRSAFSHYQPAQEQAVGAWREANEQTVRAGGWRAYARETQQPTPPAEPAAGSARQATEPASPQPAPKGGHHGHHHH